MNVWKSRRELIRLYKHVTGRRLEGKLLGYLGVDSLNGWDDNIEL